jgi:hypothetical protein
MNENVTTDGGDTILEKGLNALSNALGPKGMVQFLNEYRYKYPKVEDYTADRHTWLPLDATIEELVKTAEEMAEKERAARLRA